MPIVIEPIADRTLRSAPDGADDPARIDGIEFIEFYTVRPQALGQVLELMGFRPVARHRSREVLLYRQGDMNVVVNSHRLEARAEEPMDTPVIAAVAFRMRDAARSYRHALDRGAWPVATRVEVMELNIPAIHGAGTTRIYFVDRYREFSIYSVDFVPIPNMDAAPPAIGGMHWFGLVQYVARGRLDDWTEFYQELFGFTALPDHTQFGILGKGRILQSPSKVHLQLIEPEADVPDLAGEESFQRIGFGVNDVTEAVEILRRRGVEFYESENLHVTEKGALTTAWLGGVMFELVSDPRAARRPA